MESFPKSLSVLEHQLHQAHRNYLLGQLQGAGLQEIGHPLLLCILHTGEEGNSDGQSPAQRELAQLLHISPAAVATSLKSLEKKGYIHREPTPQDARRNRITLTEKGEQAVRECRECLNRTGQKMYEGFSPQEQELLRGFYLRMLENLGGVPG